jgi:hypothetical protein
MQYRSYRAGGQRAHAEQRQRAQGQEGGFNLTQLLPIIAFFVLTFFNFGSDSPSTPAYALQRGPRHPYKKETAMHGVPYYVGDGFERRYAVALRPPRAPRPAPRAPRPARPRLRGRWSALTPLAPHAGNGRAGAGAGGSTTPMRWTSSRRAWRATCAPPPPLRTVAPTHVPTVHSSLGVESHVRPATCAPRCCVRAPGWVRGFRRGEAREGLLRSDFGAVGEVTLVPLAK